MDVLVSTATLLVAMVFFVCEACNESLKKNKVETHRWSCRGCWVLTCVDCSKQFAGRRVHTAPRAACRGSVRASCMHKENKGDVKQRAWIDGVQQRLSVGQRAARGYMDRLMAHDNVPRKRAKFVSFAKNSLNLKADREGTPSSSGSSWRRPRRRRRRRPHPRPHPRPRGAGPWNRHRRRVLIVVVDDDEKPPPTKKKAAAAAKSSSSERRHRRTTTKAPPKRSGCRAGRVVVVVVVASSDDEEPPPKKKKAAAPAPRRRRRPAPAPAPAPAAYCGKAAQPNLKLLKAQLASAGGAAERATDAVAAQKKLKTARADGRAPAELKALKKQVRKAVEQADAAAAGGAGTRLAPAQAESGAPAADDDETVRQRGEGQAGQGRWREGRARTDCPPARKSRSRSR